jgi:hypothetical protein
MIFVSNDQACEKISGNKNWKKLQAFVEFPRSNTAGTLLVAEFIFRCKHIHILLKVSKSAQ